MITKIVQCAFLAQLGFMLGVAQAAEFLPGDTLSIGPGSWFAIDQDGNREITAAEMVEVEPGIDGGIRLGVTQAVGSIDTWAWLGNIGGHYTTVAPSGSTETGLDFSGWWIWDGDSSNEGSIDEGVWTPVNCDELGCEGVNFISYVAAIDWSGLYGDDFSLWYAWSFNPVPGCFGCTMDYFLHLEGIVLSREVPLPAAAWLFAFGLMVLVSAARRHGCLEN